MEETKKRVVENEMDRKKQTNQRIKCFFVIFLICSIDKLTFWDIL